MNTYTVKVETLRRHGFHQEKTDITTWVVAGHTIDEAITDAIEKAWRNNDYFQIALRCRVVSVVIDYVDAINAYSDVSHVVA